jgi:hypothetical protein
MDWTQSLGKVATTIALNKPNFFLSNKQKQELHLVQNMMDRNKKSTVIIWILGDN